MRHPFAPTALLTAWILSALLGPASPAGADSRTEALARARAAIEAEDPDEALRQLRPLVERGRPDAEALVLRSEVHVLLGDVAGAFTDLEQALEIDRDLRQGWLNLAGLEIAQANYEQALAALEEARRIDPAAADNDLNLGAIQVLRGRRDLARPHLERYLATHPRSSDAHYLVAANYALGGWPDLAVPALESAIRLDERLRLRARSDDRFLSLDGSPAYHDLLQRDLWSPPAGHRTAAAAFAVPWNRQDPRLLYALLEAFREAGLDWNPTIETADRWALVWGGLRAKIATQSNGTGMVSLSAPPDRTTDAEWQELTQRIFRSVWTQLQSPDP